MSHIVGTVQEFSPSIVIGPSSGLPPTSPGVWAHNFRPHTSPRWNEAADAALSRRQPSWDESPRG
jgi:hypothetical protein